MVHKSDYLILAHALDDATLALQAIQVLAENGTLEALHKKWIEYSATCAMPSTILAQPVPQLDVDAFQGLWCELAALP